MIIWGNIIYYGGLSYCIIIALYWVLGSEGSIKLGKKYYDWDYMIWIPILNILAFIAIVIELFGLIRRKK